jgi:hypothetical protein
MFVWSLITLISMPFNLVIFALLIVSIFWSLIWLLDFQINKFICWASITNEWHILACWFFLFTCHWECILNPGVLRIISLLGALHFRNVWFCLLFHNIVGCGRDSVKVSRRLILFSCAQYPGNAYISSFVSVCLPLVQLNLTAVAWGKKLGFFHICELFLPLLQLNLT